MDAQWEKGYDQSVILKKLESIRSLDGQQLSFTGFEYSEYMGVLRGMIVVDEDISSAVANNLITKGIHEAFRRRDITPNLVINAVKQEVREYKKKPLNDYWLLTTINVHIRTDLARCQINGNTICFYKALPEKFKKARAEYFRTVSSWLTDRDQSFSHYLVTKVSSRNPHDAVELALESIDLLRGIWNLSVSKDMVLQFGGRKKPVNPLLLGPLHTLHDKSGNQACESYWYQPEYNSPAKLVDFSRERNDVLLFTSKIRDMLARHKYGTEVKTGIVRYVRSLDSSDFNSAFIKLWSVLEYLTNTLNDPYKKTIRRSAFLSKDRDYDLQVLEHLKTYRNRSVHLGAEESDIDTSLYQLKNHVERLLYFHIRNELKVESLAHAATFMDSSTDIQQLQQKIKLLNSAVRFLQHN